MRLKMAQLGWPSDGEPVAMLMTSHGELERELAAERALADRLARTLDTIGHGGREQFRWSLTKAELVAREALAAWKEARRDPA
jgi:hypothetical protein